jgi:DNA-binding NarL/FixJ family response regulator
VGWIDARRRYLGGVDASLRVVVLDDAAGIDVVLARVPEIRAAHSSAKIVLLAHAADDALLAKATDAHIDAVISKTASPAAVGMLVREIAAGNVFHFPAAPAATVRSTPAAEALTNRELEILSLVASGLSNGRIASLLWVTEQTVKFHLSNIYRKLDVANRTQAAHYAHLNGLVDAGNGQPKSSSVFAAA